MSGNTYIHRHITPGDLSKNIPDILTCIWYDIKFYERIDAHDLEIYRISIYDIKDNRIVGLIVDHIINEDIEYIEFEEKLLDAAFHILWDDCIIESHIENNKA